MFESQLQNQEIKAEGGSMISNVVQMDYHLDFSGLAKALKEFLDHHWKILLILIAVCGFFLIVYYIWSDKYLLDPLPVLGIAASTVFVIVLWYQFSRQDLPNKWLLAFNIVISCAFFGVLGGYVSTVSASNPTPSISM
jgi:hypothetical protein